MAWAWWAFYEDMPEKHTRQGPMIDRKYSPLLKSGAVALGLGFMLFVVGLAYGWGCDFDTMNVCRPFGLWTGGSFLVVGLRQPGEQLP